MGEIRSRFRRRRGQAAERRLDGGDHRCGDPRRVATARRTLADYAAPTSKPARPGTAPGPAVSLTSRPAARAQERSGKRPVPRRHSGNGPIRIGDGAQRGADALELVLAVGERRRPGKRGLVHAPLDRRPTPGPRNVRGSMSGDVPDVPSAGRADDVSVTRTHPHLSRRSSRSRRENSVGRNKGLQGSSMG
jgi:hypothetical protein